MKEGRIAAGRDRSSRFCVRGFAGCTWLLTIALVYPAIAHPTSGSEPNSEKTILVLHSFSDKRIYDPIDATKAALQSHLPWPVKLYVEYMETQRFENKDYQRSWAETLSRAYAGTKLDLVIVGNFPALQFATEYRDIMFPGVPIVFTAVDAGRLAGRKMWPGVTGVTMSLNIGDTIDLALRLHPNTDTVAVITNKSEFERYWLAAVHAELLRHQDQIKEVDLVGLPTDQVTKSVATLPAHTVVLFQETPQESVHAPDEVYDTVAAVGQLRPTYCIFPVLCLNHGGIGGVTYNIDEQISLAAELAKGCCETPILENWWLGGSKFAETSVLEVLVGVAG